MAKIEEIDKYDLKWCLCNMDGRWQRLPLSASSGSTLVTLMTVVDEEKWRKGKKIRNIVKSIEESNF